MADSMIERVARALAAPASPIGYHREMARLVMEEMREPSEKIEGWDDVPGVEVLHGVCQDGPGKTWKALIDAALEEGR